MIAISSTRQLGNFLGSEDVIDGHIVSVPADTAKEAFAKAIDWQVAKQINDVAISDGSGSYSIAEFSAKMAFSEIAATVGSS
jgi:hypothetical protein